MVDDFSLGPQLDKKGGVEPATVSCAVGNGAALTVARAIRLLVGEYRELLLPMEGPLPGFHMGGPGVAARWKTALAKTAQGMAR